MAKVYTYMGWGTVVTPRLIVAPAGFAKLTVTA